MRASLGAGAYGGVTANLTPSKCASRVSILPRVECATLHAVGCAQFRQPVYCLGSGDVHSLAAGL